MGRSRSIGPSRANSEGFCYPRPRGYVRTVAIALLALAGCIDEFHGSNVQVDFSPAMLVQASAQAMAPAEGEVASNSHFVLYAFQDAADADGNAIGHLFELQRFEIHHIVDLRSPCFIDVGPNVPVAGLHVTQFAAKIKELNGIDDIANPPPGKTEAQLIDVATAMQRQMNIGALASEQGPKVVTSQSKGAYVSVAPECNGIGIPPSTCTDDASNARRLELCENTWRDDIALYEGTDRILTSPLSGTTFGMVDGINPINLAPIGGAQFFVDEGLADFDGYAIYHIADDAPAGALGELILFGRPVTQITRGVIRVEMTSLLYPAITADLAIFANLDQDEVHF
jgi:hypothetical protein